MNSQTKKFHIGFKSLKSINSYTKGGLIEILNAFQFSHTMGEKNTKRQIFRGINDIFSGVRNRNITIVVDGCKHLCYINCHNQTVYINDYGADVVVTPHTVFSEILDKYIGMDIVYIIEFIPYEYTVPGKKCYIFGFTSNITERLKKYESEKKWKKVMFREGFIYTGGGGTSKGEKRLKRITNELNVKIKYMGFGECFVANDYEFSLIKLDMTKHCAGMTSNKTHYVEIEKYKLLLESCKVLLKSGVITFEQFTQVR
jgi:hypothetical protein